MRESICDGLFARRFRLSELLVRDWYRSFWRWFRSFSFCGGFVCPNCWLGIGVGICLFGAVYGRSVYSVVSFHLSLLSAPRVGRPSPNSARKCEVRVVVLLCLNISPRIPGGACRAGRRPTTLRFGRRDGHPRSHSGAPKGASEKRMGEAFRPTSRLSPFGASKYNNII